MYNCISGDACSSLGGSFVDTSQIMIEAKIENNTAHASVSFWFSFKQNIGDRLK